MVQFGVDFGAKNAGTTAVCLNQNGKLICLQTKKGEDADKFLEKLIASLKPELIMLDAPLSLPAVYFGKGADYFFRHCDKELLAMSPMFLGGLTARAMKLKSFVDPLGLKILETYPKQIAKSLSMTYDVPEDEVFVPILRQTQMSIDTSLQSKHAKDALLAWYAGWRYLNGSAVFAGKPEEGLIWY